MKFPLRRHDFSVDTGDVDFGKEAGLVVSLDDVSAVDPASPYTAIVWPLRSRKASFWPTIGPTIETKQGVFLLKTEPRLLRCVCLHQPRGLMTVVELIGSAIMIPGFAENEDVLPTSERIGIDGNRAKIDIRVVTRGLTARGSIKIPFRKLFDILAGFV